MSSGSDRVSLRISSWCPSPYGIRSSSAHPCQCARSPCQDSHVQSSGCFLQALRPTPPQLTCVVLAVRPVLGLAQNPRRVGADERTLGRLLVLARLARVPSLSAHLLVREGIVLQRAVVQAGQPGPRSSQRSAPRKTRPMENRRRSVGIKGRARDRVGPGASVDGQLVVGHLLSSERQPGVAVRHDRLDFVGAGSIPQDPHVSNLSTDTAL